MLYVDQLFLKVCTDKHAHALGALNGHKWCHFWCDLDEERELHDLAERMGVPRGSYQELPLGSHYLLTPAKRAQALRLGAKERSYIAWLRERRQAAERATPSLFPEVP